MTTTDTITRVWAMPSPDTFSIPPIADLLDRWLEGRVVIVDPFARRSTRGTITNDLNPDMPTDYHMTADDFADMLAGRGVESDVVLFDPPYSPRQIAECYQSAGLATSTATTQNAALYSRTRDGMDRVLRPGGIAISFGWNSGGFGKKYGYERLETMLVAHGGAHNDTIVVVERKPDNLFGKAPTHD